VARALHRVAVSSSSSSSVRRRCARRSPSMGPNCWGAMLVLDWVNSERASTSSLPSAQLQEPRSTAPLVFLEDAL
jgi:hypothetical protein